MGYLTRYELDIENMNPEEKPFIVETFKNKGIIDYALDEDFDFYDSVKWYDHEEQMREISRMFPHLIFHLNGEGEEAGDLWQKHFKGGKMQACYAEIVYPPFDPKELR